MCAVTGARRARCKGMWTLLLAFSLRRHYGHQKNLDLVHNGMNATLGRCGHFYLSIQYAITKAGMRELYMQIHLYRVCWSNLPRRSLNFRPWRWALIRGRCLLEAGSSSTFHHFCKLGSWFLQQNKFEQIAKMCHSPLSHGGHIVPGDQKSFVLPR